MDYNSYRRSLRNKTNNQDSNNDIDKTKLDYVEKTINSYSKMTDEEMMSALFNEVNKEKRKGIFDIGAIRKFYKEIAPMLDNNARSKMRAIIEELEK